MVGVEDDGRGCGAPRPRDLLGAQGRGAPPSVPSGGWTVVPNPDYLEVRSPVRDPTPDPSFATEERDGFVSRDVIQNNRFFLFPFLLLDQTRGFLS